MIPDWWLNHVLFCAYSFVSCAYSCKTPSTLAHLHKSTLWLTPAEYSRKPQSHVEPPPGLTVVLSGINVLTRQGKQVASEIIVSTTDRDTNNGIRMDRRAQREILTPASLTVKRRMTGWDKQQNLPLYI